MSHYKPYPAYKDSGVEWLGPIPEHWQVSSVKWEFESQLGKMLQPEKKQNSDVQVPYHKAVSVQWESVAVEAPESMWASPTEIDTYRIKQGDLLICEGGDVGRSAIFDGEDSEPIIIQNSIHRVRPKSGNQNAILLRLMQACRHSGWFDVLCSKATIVHFTAEKLGDLAFPLAPPEEQRAIAAHLDRETARIDALVAKKTRFIELLREKRQALITHAVTKGLDPNVKMKDSGVEWLGEVPEGWEIKSVRHVLAAIGDVDHFMPESVDNGVPYLMTGDLKDFLSNVSLQDCKQVSHGDYFRLSRRIKSSKGDIVMARYATIGTLMYVDVDVDFLVSYSCVTLKPDLSKMSGLYLFHYMKSTAFHEGIKNQINTNTQDNVGIKDLQSVKIAVPPIEEQAAIAAFLDFETTKLDALKNKIERSIELLKERRSALITAAVTGQIDLREAA